MSSPGTSAACLLQPPIPKQVVLAIDPGLRSGCKVAVLDPQGNLLDQTVIYPHAPQNRRSEAKLVLKDLVGKHQVGVVAIGNGTACRETEELIAEIIAEGIQFSQGQPPTDARTGLRRGGESGQAEPTSHSEPDGRGGTRASSRRAGAAPASEASVSNPRTRRPHIAPEAAVSSPSPRPRPEPATILRARSVRAQPQRSGLNRRLPIRTSRARSGSSPRSRDPTGNSHRLPTEPEHARSDERGVAPADLREVRPNQPRPRLKPRRSPISRSQLMPGKSSRTIAEPDPTHEARSRGCGRHRTRRAALPSSRSCSRADRDGGVAGFRGCGDRVIPPPSRSRRLSRRPRTLQDRIRPMRSRAASRSRASADVSQVSEPGPEPPTEMLLDSTGG